MINTILIVENKFYIKLLYIRYEYFRLFDKVYIQLKDQQ